MNEIKTDCSRASYNPTKSKLMIGMFKAMARAGIAAARDFVHVVKKI